MAKIRPFKAVRPAANQAEKVISLPYDVMNRKEASEMAQDNPASFLHICRSEIDLPEVSNQYSKEVYEKAKSNISDFINDGIFIRDEKPCLYIYRQIMDGRVQTGIALCASIDDYLNNIIKKHEFTRHEKELDRINHFDVCNANTEPVFLTYRENDLISNTIANWSEESEPAYELTTDDGIEHILWVIDDETIIDAIVSEFEEIPALYIADGHHRSASAVKVGQKRREENPNYSGDEEFNFFMAVAFPDSDLKIFDYNRAVKDLNGLSVEDYLEKVSQKFTIDKNDSNEAYRPKNVHEFGMYLEKQWYKLVAKDEIINENNVIERLDVSILQENLLSPILGIDDPRTDKRIDFIGGIRGLGELERRVNEDMKVAFSLYPVQISDLLSVSDENQVMPPKSTWFEPKLGSGLFVHEL